MNRRYFLSLCGLSVAGVVLDKAIPNGRVWSFPAILKSRHGLKVCSFPDAHADSVRISDFVDVRIVETKVFQAPDGAITIFPPVGNEGPRIHFPVEDLGAIFQIPTRMLKPPDFSDPETQEYFRHLQSRR